MVIQLSHIHENQEHLITAEVWASQPATMTSPAEPEAYDILSCDLLVDGFRFDGILPDATILAHIAANKSKWVQVEPQHPYNGSASVMEVLQEYKIYSPEKVAAAKKIFNQILNS